MTLLTIIVLAVVALIVACILIVALRNRRTSGGRPRFESGPQEAPFTEEAGINQQGNRNNGGSAGI